LSFDEAIAQAVPMLARLAEVAKSANTVLCIEPNARDYGADFVTNTQEGIALVKAVNHEGFGLHLDTGTMILENENIEESIEQAAPYLCHFHVAEPMLEPVSHSTRNLAQHQRASKALQEIRYSKWVTVE